MTDVLEEVCFALSRRMMKPPPSHTDNWDTYSDWRSAELEKQWAHFDTRDITGKDVLDFGCGFGNLSFFLARFAPKQILGVELNPLGLERAEILRQKIDPELAKRVRFELGIVDRVPADDQSFDTIVAFDCLEHIGAVETILREWHRVLRPRGKVLIWWSPYRGPWGPHMESVIPIPWAHVWFGEKAMLRTAARMYDLEDFAPRPWHFDEHGARKPNQWKQWSTFAEQGHINQLTLADFRALADRTGFDLTRLEPHGFGGSLPRRTLGRALVNLPVLGEWMTSYYIVECTRRSPT